MPIRMSGLASGLDTDSIIKELMSAQSLKKTKIEQKKTKLEWSQEKWKDLNTKIYNLYTNQVSKMRLESSYKTKAVSSSDETKVTATAGPNAATGSHTISVSQLASAQYLTSSKINLADGSGKEVTTATKLTDLGFTTDGTNSVINISGKKDVSFIVTNDMTVNDLVSAFKDAGLNASFDTTQQRLFVSSADSGVSQQFSVTTGTVSNEFVAARDALRTNTGYSNLSTADKAKVDEALKTFYYGGTGGTVAMDSLSKEQTDAHLALVDFATKAAKTQTVNEANKEVRDTVIAQEFAGKDQEQVIKDALAESIKKENSIYTDDDVRIMVNEKYDKMTEKDRTTSYNKIIDAKVAEVKGKDDYKQIYDNYIKDHEETNINTHLSDLDTQLVDYAAKSGEEKYSSGATPLSNIGMSEISLVADANGISRVQINGTSGTANATEANNTIQYGGMSLVGAQDAHFTLDGAELTSENNSFTVNSLNLNLTGVTSSPVSLNVTNDTQATYDAVKEFVTEYNKILKEMNTLYYATSSRGYEPLSDDEKEAMSDDQIEKWETKIKDSLLRRDTTLGSLTTAMKQAMQTSVEIDGKNYSLSSYGICTSSDYTEYGLLHIYGDTTDATYATESDKLMKALADDPETTIQALTGIAQKLYETMQDKMKSTTLSSALTFYNDKQMKTQVSDYTTQISDWEDRLQDMEDRYYKQFSSMESAMSNLNSQSSYLTNLMG